MHLPDLIAVARGEKPADLVFKNGRIINTFTGEIDEGDVAIFDGHIAGIDKYSKAREIIDLKGDYLAPGFINGHIHIESSMLHPIQYARAVVPHGTTSIVTDLHEITNVAGIPGIKFVMDCEKQLPLDIFFQAPSCVPATHMETAGATISTADIARLLKWKNNVGLGEMMNYPGIINTFPDILSKVEVSKDSVICGHAPGLSGKQLNAYIAAGIYSDHENTEVKEGKEKLRLGMHLMIREGSSEKNLATLLPLVTDKTWRRCLFVVDDRSCSDLLKDGDVDAVIRKAIRLGLNPVRAIQMATLNPAEYFRLKKLGSIAPGYRANLITLKNLDKLSIDKVYYDGKLVAGSGKYLAASPKARQTTLTSSVNIKPFRIKDLQLNIKSEKFPCIEIIPGQIVTKKSMIKVKSGIFQTDLTRDILKAVVIERHQGTGNIGIGIVKGFGLKRGAIATTIAHDSHNLVIVGASDEDIYAAAKAIQDMQGGLVVCKDGKPIAKLPLPVAGLLSQEDAPVVSNQFDAVEKAASMLGKLPPAPFALLSFIALPVIPELRLTDKGIVDVIQFKIIS